MEFFEDIKANFDDFVERTSKLTVTILAILLFLFVSAIIVLIFALSSTSKKKAFQKARTPLSAEDSFLPPSQLKLTQDYYFSREATSSWNRKESDRWFSKPNSVNMNELHQANEQVVDEIIGAAP